MALLVAGAAVFLIAFFLGVFGPMASVRAVLIGVGMVLALVVVNWDSSVEYWWPRALLRPECSLHGLAQVLLSGWLLVFAGLVIFGILEGYRCALLYFEKEWAVPTEQYVSGYAQGYRAASTDALLSFLAPQVSVPANHRWQGYLTTDGVILIKVGDCGCHLPGHDVLCGKKDLLDNLRGHPWYESHSDSIDRCDAEVRLRHPLKLNLWGRARRWGRGAEPVNKNETAGS